MGLTLRNPDAILLSFDRSVGLLGGAVCTRTAGCRDLIEACAKAPITGLSALPDRRVPTYPDKRKKDGNDQHDHHDLACHRRCRYPRPNPPRSGARLRGSPTRRSRVSHDPSRLPSLVELAASVWPS